MKTEPRPRPEKRPPPRLDLTGPEWKLAVTGALGLAWTITWLALAKPSDPAPIERPTASMGAPPSGPPAQAPPSRGGATTPTRGTAASAPAPRLAAATPTPAPRRAPIRIRTRAS